MTKPLVKNNAINNSKFASQKSVTKSNFFQTRLPLYYVILVAILSVVIGFLMELGIASRPNPSGVNQNSRSLMAVSSTASNDNVSSIYKNIDILCRNDYLLTHPIILTNIEKESADLQSLKANINTLVSEYKNKDILNSTSVYILDFSNNGWININETEEFHPASLMKLTILISVLKESELHPEVLQQILTFDKNTYAPHQTYEDPTIIPGNSYTVKDLLERMIIHSDNFATTLLDQHLDTNYLCDIFTTLKIPRKPFLDPDFSISSRNYSKLLQVLYNASYLNAKNSEFALSILTRTNFKKGLTQPLPPNVTCAHKFGENSFQPVKELHEAGIIYCGKKPYLLTVLTKGKNINSLSNFISNLSLQVYQHFSSAK